MSNAVAHADAVTATRTRHHPALQHHFDTMAQQNEAAVVGMWVFLLTEILFFGGLFVAYMLYRDLVLRGVRRSQPSARHRSGAASTPPC